ncbi:MAG: (2Fe-2S)-binding protein [Gammaproteobacteria bacterium]|nr:(2Fe-2S)-binding protein [Gammaproteobacteria bacterium]
MQPVNPQLTRRRFIKGVIASGAVAGTTSLWYAASGQSRPAGAVERMLRLNVNGQERTVDVAPQETLASTLRYKLGLTGTKLGCNRGECGACTVLVDDIPTYACSVLTHSMKDGRIETVEGLEAPDGTLHPVQQGFVEALSPQCGYCTPGQVMAAVGLLRVNPNPTREQVREGLAGNLCRCGSYDSYLDGVMRAVELG